MSCGVSSAGIVGSDAAGTLSFPLSGLTPGRPGSDPSTLVIVPASAPSPGIEGSDAGAVDRPSTLEPGAGTPLWAPVSGVVGWSSVFSPTIASTSRCAGTLGGVALARKLVPLAL